MASCDGALVSVDASNGRIVAILPLNGTRGAGASQVTREGENTIVRGSLLGAFDAEARDLFQAAHVRSRSAPMGPLPCPGKRKLLQAFIKGAAGKTYRPFSLNTKLSTSRR